MFSIDNILLYHREKLLSMIQYVCLWKRKYEIHYNINFGVNYDTRRKIYERGNKTGNESS